MRLLITGGDGRLARAVAASLTGRGDSLRLIAAAFTDEPPSGVEARVGDLRDPEFAAGIVAGMDAILHLAPLCPSAPNDPDAILDEAGRGTYVLLNAALDAGIRRIAVGSTLDLFDRLPTRWKVDEDWRPRPTPRPSDLGPWLAELSTREMARTAPDARALCLRFGRIVGDSDAAALPYDPRWLHVEDAVTGVRQALAYLQNDGGSPGWRPFHITAAGPRAKIRLARAGREEFGYRPVHDFRDRRPGDAPGDAGDERPWREVLAPPAPIRSRPIRRVVLFGAGGPVAAAAAAELASSYTLRLADLRPLAEIAGEAEPQSPGAPLPSPLGPPHECRVVDVRNGPEVLAACAGMDAIVNCTVNRPDPTDAFLVNLLGAYHILRAAVAHDIRRVVQTGPQQIMMDPRVDYEDDYELPGDVPARPGRSLYGHSKYLGQEICRVFAEYHDLEAPTLLYMQFVAPEVTESLYWSAVSWQDSARAIRRALEVPALPSPFVVMNICADLPHGRVSPELARTVLGWEPRDAMERLWTGAEGELG